MAADGPGPARTAGAAFLLTGLLVGAGVAVAAATGVAPAAAISGAALGALTFVVLLRVVGGEGSAWEPLSVEQYAGRLVESGGPSRAEQEEAVDEAAETPEQLEDAEEG